MLYGKSCLGDNLDLNKNILGKGFYGYAGTRGLTCEVGSVNRVERRKVVNIGKEANGLNRLVKAAARSLENVFEVFANFSLKKMKNSS